MHANTLKTLLAATATAALAIGGAYLASRRTRDFGSRAGANDAHDDMALPPQATSDDVLDVGVMHSFPASDPPAIEKAFETAYENEERLKKEYAAPKSETGGEKEAAPAAPRSADWLARR